MSVISIMYHHGKAQTIYIHPVHKNKFSYFLSTKMSTITGGIRKFQKIAFEISYIKAFLFFEILIESSV